MSYIGFLARAPLGVSILVRREGDQVAIIQVTGEHNKIQLPAADAPDLCRHVLNIAAEIGHQPEAAPPHHSPLQERITYWRRKLRFHR
jgi:hypothetical protein